MPRPLRPHWLAVATFGTIAVLSGPAVASAATPPVRVAASATAPAVARLAHEVSSTAHAAAPATSALAAAVPTALASTVSATGAATAARAGVASPTQTLAHSFYNTNNTLRAGWGLVEDGFPQTTTGLATVVNLVGRQPNFMETYVHWGGGWGALTQALPFIQGTFAQGATPVVTWLSDDPSISNESAYDLANIANGAFDPYLISWADGLRTLGRQVFIRFDSEMNGNWSSYSIGKDGQKAADYVNAWRHIHNVFAQQGANNVRWVWSPNVEYTGSTPLRSLYPGDAYVDWLALDGYNWGTTNSNGWHSFADVFFPSIADIESISHRPVMLAEVGCTEVGGSKAAWITDMFAQLKNRPDIQAFIWFDMNKETDWRIVSSSTSAAAFAGALDALPVRSGI